MWQRYKKTFIPVQAMIILMCLFLLLAAHMPAFVVLFAFFLPMEGAGFIGAAWAYRLKNKIENARERLPLSIKR